jgi:RNA polymerase sigma-70 factor (family 1)
MFVTEVQNGEVKILKDDQQKQLLVLLRQGNEPAFNTLYKAYSKPLYLWVLRMVKNADDADELLQELFIKLWDNRKIIDLEKSFKSYMYTIAHNLVSNYFRKIANDQALIRSILQNATIYYLNAQELLENKEVSKLLQQAIDQLTRQRKQVFQLCKIEGKSYEEAAELMGISIATINSHMTKSLQSIREYLHKHQDLMILVLTAYAISGTLK